MTEWFAGDVVLAEGVEEGYVAVEGGRIADAGLGACPERPRARGWICPAPVNAHTHVADTFLRSHPKPASVAELVGPGGWKARQLAAASASEVVSGMRQVADEMAAVGTACFIDFREGGAAGAKLLRGAGLDVPAQIYGRPAANTFDEDEAAQVLAVVDGVGLSALRDFPRKKDVAAWAEFCHDAHKPFALHASEAVREPMDAILSMEPAFLVHATSATRGDLDAVAAAGLPVVVCPRSNSHNGIRTPLDRYIAAGVTVALGTDNGMLADGNILQEAAQLFAWFGSSTPDLLRMATWNGRQVAGLATRWPPRRGAVADWVVYPERPWAPAPDGRPGLTIEAP
ncbi:MAG: amidohydrolase family protein [Thermoplasmatota archaeon]